MMLILAIFAPPPHGAIGPLDELELCVAPIVAVLILLIAGWRSRSRRKTSPMRDRQQPRRKDR
jgi:hypothetical protein